MEIKNIRLVLDESYPDKIEIHMLDTDGSIAEGGQFDLDSFLKTVMNFYNENF
jgi:hypothetical protein